MTLQENLTVFGTICLPMCCIYTNTSPTGQQGNKKTTTGQHQGSNKNNRVHIKQKKKNLKKEDHMLTI